jgi:ankyrin repeat protein
MASNAFNHVAAPEYVLKDLLDAIEKKDRPLIGEIIASKRIPMDGSLGDGWTPLYRAIATGEKDIVKQVLDGGAHAEARPSYVDSESWTPLTFAIGYYRSTPAIVAMLLEAGAQVNSPSHAEHGEKPLQFAVKRADEASVELLLQKGADPNTEVFHGETVVHLAAQEGLGEVIRILKRHGGDIDRKSDFEWTPLDKALIYRHREAFEVLIDEGADVSPRHDNRSTLLMSAAIWGETGVIDFLVQKGYGVDYQNGEGKTALYYAANAGRGASVRRLLELGADPNVAANDGETPRQIAQKQGNTHVVSLIDGKNAMLANAGTSVAIKPVKPFRITLGAKNGQ